MMYRVVWECDIDAATPEAAALEAESIMHDYATDGHRPVLDVYWRTDMGNEEPLGMGAYESPNVAREEIDLEAQEN